MAIRDRLRGGTPGQELKNFTDREAELAVLQRLLDLDEPAQLPAIMFYGVGGTGKSWLLKRLRNWLAERSVLPSAYVDFDRNAPGGNYLSDFSTLLAEVWRQLDVECPRFEMAYTWMRFKQGTADHHPLIRHSGRLETGWGLIKEITSAGFNWVPGVNVLVWVADKLGKAAAERLQVTSVGKRLLTQAGEEDYLRLSRMTAQEIYPTLVSRLAEDLDEQLPRRGGKRCRAVIFLDTFEDLAGGEQNEARRHFAEEPIRELYRRLTSVLLVLFGRDRLTWDEVDPEWADRSNLEQHLLGGLSRHDATSFLGKCGIGAGSLLEAILRVSRDQTTPDREAYYPFSLGLCADTVHAERNRGEEPSPDTFDMAPGDYGKLAPRFLKSLHDEHPEKWIIRLAQTPRFDEAAARAAFSATRDVDQDRAWESLRDYSFVQEDAESGWFRIHSVMSEVLRRRLSGDQEKFAREHADWQARWQSRSQRDTDEFAGLAWYHEYVLAPEQALSAWNTKARQARAKAQMPRHFDLLNWWTPTQIEVRPPRLPGDAKALILLGVELWNATLGNRSANLRRAIVCYEAALRIYTESDFPADWAGTLNNLGVVYDNLPTGDRCENVLRSIDCYKAALRIFTETDFPSIWAMTESNLGNAYCNLPTGDRGVSLRRAIDCYEAALRVRTESVFPVEWAATLNNLGIAYHRLPMGDRGENVRRAIDCFETALRVYTESDYPAEWAKTQVNLGIAYGMLPTGDRGEHFSRAIACYQAALRVYTEPGFPAEWATTQDNLGIAYSKLSTGDHRENLHRAIACYQAALRVRSESAYPAESAKTQFNLGLALREQGRFGESARAFESATRAYEAVGDRETAEESRKEAEKSRSMSQSEAQT